MHDGSLLFRMGCEYFFLVVVYSGLPRFSKGQSEKGTAVNGRKRALLTR